MRRLCDGSDPYLLGADGASPCRCGLEFDDVERTVIFPHVSFRDAKARWADAWVGDVSPTSAAVTTDELPLTAALSYVDAVRRVRDKALLNARGYVVLVDRLAPDREPGARRFYVRAAHLSPPDPDRYLEVLRVPAGG